MKSEYRTERMLFLIKKSDNLLSVVFLGHFVCLLCVQLRYVNSELNAQVV